MPIDPGAVQWDSPIDPGSVQWNVPAQSKPGPPQPLSFGEKYIAPLIESMAGTSNIQGSPVGRLVQGAADAPIGIMQLAGNALGMGGAVNSRVNSLEQQYQSQRAAAGSTGFDPLRMAGNVGAALAVPGAMASPISFAGKPGLSLLANTVRGGAAGAAFNAAQPVTNAQPTQLSDLVTGNSPGDYWSQKLNQTESGAAFGAGGVPVSSMLARIVRPNISPQVQTLLDAGVTPTPGQIMGGGFHRIEDAATSIPALGDVIKSAQNRTLGDLNIATYDRALNPIGTSAAELGLKPGPDGVLGVKTALGSAYDDLLPKLSFDVGTIAPQLDGLRKMAANGLRPQEATTFSSILDSNLGQLTDGKADGLTFKGITSNLGTQAKGFGNSTDNYQRDLGQALGQAQTLFRQGLTASNPEYASQLNAIDIGYANYVRIRQAAQMAGDKSNGFTPAQLSSAVRASDSSVGNGATATGTALMQDLSDAARSVLPPTVADSGTPLRRAMMASGALLAGEHIPDAIQPWLLPIAGGMGLAALPYTKLGQAASAAVLARRPSSASDLAAALRQLGPLAGAAGVPALTQGN